VIVREATLCLLVKGDPPVEVLMGLKKEGFGLGKVAGFGGKLEPGETAIAAAAREIEEETGILVSAEDLIPVGRLHFRFPAHPQWSQDVHVFLARSWQGRAEEGREMQPFWYSVDSLPFEEMWQDGAHWLPPILAGKRIRGWFTFRGDNETLNEVVIERWDGGPD
jgi:8-oxo-dGTP pyrophosphatase MutT (NUDIX family)